ncbi:MAG TPA: VTT domain-containing protein [Clostridia bacterium]|nr:VTT domain-containing protein [Clostridia bacterium]
MTADAESVNQESPEAAERAGDVAAAKPPWRKILLLALIAAVFLTVVYLTPLREYRERLGEISKYIKGLGMLAPLALTLSVAVLVAVGFPRLLCCVIAGMALGFWSGLLWAQIGTLMGNYVTFMVARSGSKEWVKAYLSKRGRLHNLIQREGVAGVILARQLPVPGLLINLTCGLFSVRHRDFFFGTIIGQLPEAIPCTLIGAGALQPSFTKSFGIISLAVVAAVVTWVGLRWALRRSERSQIVNGPPV